MSASTTHSLLTLHDICHTYGDRVIVDHLNLSIAAGDICCLLGPSGCGKTTVLRCIGGFERLSSGLITIDGHLVSGTGRHVPPERRRIGMVFQDYALFPHLTVAAQRRRSACQAVRRRWSPNPDRRMVLDIGRAGTLPPNATRTNCQGGQQQRVALARALAPQPGMCCCWTSRSRTWTWPCASGWRAEVRRRPEGGGQTTAVFVTHDQTRGVSPWPTPLR
jgi:iron(III) transport system ATP-binding protein